MISVCMATYNGERFIKEQLDSILCQLSKDDEVIISDDGSTDNTVEIINSYNDKRIKILNHIPNPTFNNHEKATANFENALRVVQGDVIFLSDQDDIWNLDKIKKCKEALNYCNFVVHQMELLSQNCIDLKDVEYYKNVIPDSWILNVMHEKIWGCCICFTREVLDYVLPFPKKLIGHDYWISTIAIKKFRCILLDDKLIKYRIHNNSVSYKRKTTLFYKIKYRVVLFFYLIKKFVLKKVD